MLFAMKTGSGERETGQTGDESGQRKCHQRFVGDHGRHARPVPGELDHVGDVTLENVRVAPDRVDEEEGLGRQRRHRQGSMDVRWSLVLFHYSHHNDR